MTNQRADNQRVAAPHRRVAIVAAGRTPFIKSGKAFAEIDSLAMAVHATRGMLDRSGSTRS